MRRICSFVSSASLLLSLAACHRDRELHVCDYNPGYCADGGDDGLADDALESDAATEADPDDGTQGDAGAEVAIDSAIGDAAEDTNVAGDVAESGLDTAPPADAATCVAGTYSCSGAERRECSALGTWGTKATCATPELCSASTGPTCATPTCAIGETTCSGKVARSCKTSRDGWNDTSCTIGCSAGVCLKVAALPEQLGSHVCALLSDGSVRCWGYDSGFGATPGTVSGITGATQIAASYGSSAARLADGTLRWWGRVYTPTAPGYVVSNVPLSIPGMPIGSRVFLGGMRVCATQTDTTLKCYGPGPLGDGTATEFSTAKSIPGITGVTSANIHDLPKAAFVVVDGGAKGWGSNAWGQLGDGATAERLSPVSTYGFATQIQFHNDHACALLSTGGVRCSGANDSGQIGTGAASSTNQTTPADVVGLSSGIRAISVGADHSCALLSDKTVRCWGGNGSGELGDGTLTSRATPVAVAGLSGVTAISCGQWFSCALLETGDVRCWGNNSQGQLGIGTMSSTPVTSPASVVW